MKIKFLYNLIIIKQKNIKNVSFKNVLDKLSHITNIKDMAKDINLLLVLIEDMFFREKRKYLNKVERRDNILLSVKKKWQHMSHGL